MDRMDGAWHNHVIDVGLSCFADEGIRQGKEFAIALGRRLAAIHS